MFNDTPFRHEAENSKESCSCGKNLKQCNCKSKKEKIRLAINQIPINNCDGSANEDAIKAVRYLQEVSVDTLEQKPKNGFDAWVQVLEEEEQPVACSVDNPDCENCGS